jgi:hypothetical protein
MEKTMRLNTLVSKKKKNSFNFNTLFLCMNIRFVAHFMYIAIARRIILTALKFITII